MSLTQLICWIQRPWKISRALWLPDILGILIINVRTKWSMSFLKGFFSLSQILLSTDCTISSGARCIFPFLYQVQIAHKSQSPGTLWSVLLIFFSIRRVWCTIAAHPETGAAHGAAPAATIPGRPDGETVPQDSAETLYRTAQYCTVHYIKC